MPYTKFTLLEVSVLLGKIRSLVLNSVGLGRIPFCCQEPTSNIPISILTLIDSVRARIWQTAPSAGLPLFCIFFCGTAGRGVVISKNEELSGIWVVAYLLFAPTAWKRPGLVDTWLSTGKLCYCFAKINRT